MAEHWGCAERRTGLAGDVSDARAAVVATTRSLDRISDMLSRHFRLGIVAITAAVLLGGLLSYLVATVQSQARSNREGILVVCQELENHRVATAAAAEASALFHGYTYTIPGEAAPPDDHDAIDAICRDYRDANPNGPLTRGEDRGRPVAVELTTTSTTTQARRAATPRRVTTTTRLLAATTTTRPTTSTTTTAPQPPTTTCTTTLIVRMCR